MVKGRPPFSTWRCSNSRRIQRLSFPQPDYGTLGIYTQMVILELDTFEYFKDVLAPSIRQKLKR